MAFKINKQKLQDSITPNITQTQQTNTSVNLTAIQSSNKINETVTPPVTSGSVNLNNLQNTTTTNNQNTQSNTSGTNYINLTAIQAEETNGFSLTFTEGATYDLDDIIFAKKRDNANCPLIVKVNTESSQDEAVIAVITKLILSDYDIEYDTTSTNDDDPMYYKNRVHLVPSFYTVFDKYFNQFYQIYYNQLNTNNSLGSISLTTVIEEIQTTHDNIYESLLSNDYSVSPYSINGVSNKPKVEFEYGTMPTDDDYNPGTAPTGSGDAIVEKFSLDIESDNLVLKYDDQIIEDCSVPVSDLIETVFDVTECSDISLCEDIGWCPDFTATNVVFENINSQHVCNVISEDILI